MKGHDLEERPRLSEVGGVLLLGLCATFTLIPTLTLALALNLFEHKNFTQILREAGDVESKWVMFSSSWCN